MSEELSEIKQSDLPQRKEEITIAESKNETAETTDAINEVVDVKRDYYYPSSIRSTQNNFPNKIIFKALRVEGVNIASLIQAGIGQLAEELTSIELSTEEQSTTATSESAGNDAESEDGSSFADKAKKKLIGVGELLAKFGTTSYENPGTGTVVGSVTLPLPRDLRYADIMAYETANLGVIGAGLEGSLRGRNPFESISLTGGGLAQATSAIGAQIIGRIGGNVVAGAVGGALAGAPGAFLGALAAGDVGEGIEGAIKSATRIVAAPNSKTLFQNVGIRNFNFAFKLIAYDPDEMKQIRQIIKFFREEMYPEVIPLGSSGIPLAYKFPSEFEIDIKNKNGDNPAFKIARCYLRDVQIAFNSTALGMYSDGNFVEVDIVLSFVEIEALHRKKIADQGY